MKVLDELEKLLIKLTTEKPDAVVEESLKEDLKTIEGVAVSFEPKLEVGAKVLVEGQEQLSGELELESGQIVVIVDGLVSEIKEKPAPAEPAPAELSEGVDYAPMIEDLQKQIDELKGMLKLSVESGISLSKELELVKAQPATTPVSTTETKHTNLHLFTKRK